MLPDTRCFVVGPEGTNTYRSIHNEVTIKVEAAATPEKADNTTTAAYDTQHTLASLKKTVCVFPLLIAPRMGITHKCGRRGLIDCA